MSSITKAERNIKQKFIGECWSYLHNNFHKFSETNKIRIAVDICKKSIPQEIEGKVNFTMMEKISVNNRVREFNLGNTIFTEDP